MSRDLSPFDQQQSTMSQPRGLATATAPLGTPSSTATATITSVESATDVVVGTISLRVPDSTTTGTTTATTGRSVVWAEEVIDNEFLDRKKSKGTSIYPKHSSWMPNIPSTINLSNRIDQSNELKLSM